MKDEVYLLIYVKIRLWSGGTLVRKTVDSQSEVDPSNPRVGICLGLF